MSQVLTIADTLLCTVGQGKVQSAGDPKLVIAGNPVLTVATLQGATVVGCAPKAQPAPPACTSVASVLSGMASKLLVSGSPVMLSGATANGAAAPPHPIGPGVATEIKLDAS